MNDKMMANDHKMMQIRHQVKDEEKTLKTEQEKLNIKRNELVEAQRQLKAFQQHRYRVRESIRNEFELARIDKANTIKNFFFKNEKEENKVDGNNLLTDDDLATLLKKKLNDKEDLLRLIEPLVKHMNGKFYIRFSKRKQRSQLKSLHKQLVKDISNLTKALELFG